MAELPGEAPHDIDELVRHLLAIAMVVAPASESPSEASGARASVVGVTDPDLLAHAGQRRATLHSAMQQLLPGGHLVLVHRPGQRPHEGELGDSVDEVARGMRGDLAVTVLQRTTRSTVHDLVAAARLRVRRVTPHELATALAQPDAPLVLDTRTPSDRQRHGTIDGSHHVPRTVLEWRLDPANGYLHPAVTGFRQPLVVVCNHGYSSSLAAANLAALGYTDVADLVGGMAGWREAGLPTVPPDHTFLEL